MVGPVNVVCSGNGREEPESILFKHTPLCVLNLNILSIF